MARDRHALPSRPAGKPSEAGPTELRDQQPEQSDPALVARIRAEIERDGPITFARFMELALYDDERGYYRAPTERPVRSGDFLTAPELHPIFGRTIARQLEECWDRLGRPDPFTIVEYGAGSGTLFLAIVDGMRRHGSEAQRALRYVPIEINEHRLSGLVERLGASGLGGIVDIPAGGARADPGSPIEGVVLANEYLDAMPVHRLVGRPGGVRELFVDWGPGGFAGVEAAASSPALPARLEGLGLTIDDGQEIELCLGLDAWISDVVAVLQRGYLLVFDYGHPAPELYAPRRRSGTVLGYRSHRVSPDPFASVGRQDLTAHVDVTTLASLGAAHGLSGLGATRQADFLVGAGIAEELQAIQADPSTQLADYLLARSAVRRLLDPRALGSFAVLALSRGVATAPPLGGLSGRLLELG